MLSRTATCVADGCIGGCRAAGGAVAPGVAPRRRHCDSRKARQQQRSQAHGPGLHLLHRASQPCGAMLQARRRSVVAQEGGSSAPCCVACCATLGDARAAAFDAGPRMPLAGDGRRAAAALVCTCTPRKPHHRGPAGAALGAGAMAPRAFIVSMAVARVIGGGLRWRGPGLALGLCQVDLWCSRSVTGLLPTRGGPRCCPVLLARPLLCMRHVANRIHACAMCECCRRWGAVC
jgi:hypothetical protein